MPLVETNKGLKKFPYTKKGKMMAKKATSEMKSENFMKVKDKAMKRMMKK